LALFFAILTLVGVMGTRLETVTPSLAVRVPEL
jgi:hypothetical protein